MDMSTQSDACIYDVTVEYNKATIDDLYSQFPLEAQIADATVTFDAITESTLAYTMSVNDHPMEVRDLSCVGVRVVMLTRACSHTTHTQQPYHRPNNFTRIEVSLGAVNDHGGDPTHVVDAIDQNSIIESA
jgi:hypothetical protein